MFPRYPYHTSGIVSTSLGRSAVTNFSAAGRSNRAREGRPMGTNRATRWGGGEGRVRVRVKVIDSQG